MICSMAAVYNVPGFNESLTSCIWILSEIGVRTHERTTFSGLVKFELRPYVCCRHVPGHVRHILFTSFTSGISPASTTLW